MFPPYKDINMNPRGSFACFLPDFPSLLSSLLPFMLLPFLTSFPSPPFFHPSVLFLTHIARLCRSNLLFFLRFVLSLVQFSLPEQKFLPSFSACPSHVSDACFTFPASIYTRFLLQFFLPSSYEKGLPSRVVSPKPISHQNCFSRPAHTFFPFFQSFPSILSHKNLCPPISHFHFQNRPLKYTLLIIPVLNSFFVVHCRASPPKSPAARAAARSRRAALAAASGHCFCLRCGAFRRFFHGSPGTYCVARPDQRSKSP